MKVEIDELMRRSGVGFGTSGARGLVADMTDEVCRAYTLGFLKYLEKSGDLKGGERVALAGDLRPSTPRIMAAVAHAISERGYVSVNCGFVPSPAVALYGIERRIPAIMVTGSHIPADRNGIKFNKPSGEILKEDEAGIRAQVVEFDESAGAFPLPAEDMDARADYLRRYAKGFPEGCLEGLTLGIYRHSAVGRDLLVEIFSALGADVTPLGSSSEFVPVDTEAIRPEDVALAKEWSEENGFDAILSTDGDSDRPLLSDESGNWLRGDVLGILAATWLGADSVSTPVSCNTAVEKCGRFAEVRRTRIGSPYVVASMQSASAAGRRGVVGYEANGGFLTNSDFSIGAKPLRALPTRDAVLPILAALLLAKGEGKTLSELLRGLPQRVTASDRIKDFPAEASGKLLERLKDVEGIEAVFGDRFGKVEGIDRTDGTRIAFASGEIVHLRPSGNAPEFRCYVESESTARCEESLATAMNVLRSMRGR